MSDPGRPDTIDVTSIEVDRQHHVTVTFGDGMTGRFDLPELRLACPCADCDGRRQQELPVAPGLLDGRPITITEVELAGAFGLDIDWSDGHRTGIYGWARLHDGLTAGTLGTRL